MVSYRALALGAGISIWTATVSSVGFAADVSQPAFPYAVAEPNGKVEFSGGWDTLTGQPNSGDWKAGASFSLPLGQSFGLQADVAGAGAFNDNLFGGAVHLFTRDPNSHLIGVLGGAFSTNNATAEFIGPELELYSGPFMFQGTAGFLNVDMAGVNSGKWYGFADASFFPQENLKFTIGAKDVADFKTAHAGLEYQFSDATPLSVTLDGRLGDSGFSAVDLGVKFYFGAPAKSLHRRMREDDPPNRILDIFNSAGNAFTPPVPTGPTCPPGWTGTYPYCINPES